METIFNNSSTEPKAGFIAKDGVIYKVHNPSYNDMKQVHYGYLAVNEHLKASGQRKQVVNFGGNIGGYIFPV